MEEFEWAIDIPVPTLYIDAIFIIDENSFETTMVRGEYIKFVIDGFDKNTEGIDIINLTILENTNDRTYKSGETLPCELDLANSLIEKGYWQLYDEKI